MNRKSVLVGVLLAFGMISCGGEGPGLAGGRTGDGAGAPGGGTDDQVVVQMGSISGGSFQEGVIGVAATNLSAGGSTTLTVNLRTDDGVPLTDSADVTFSSDCQSSGIAEIEDTVVTTTTGTATTTYIAQGCSGTDTVTARTSVNGQSLTSTVALTVAPANLGSIEFVSVEPKTIGLRGTGAAGVKETAVVKFRVLNDVGGPVPDEEVAFTLSTEVGGLELTSSDTAVTGTDGTASVTVRAGTIPTAVRITAAVVGTGITTQSSALTVSTAIPDDNSFSLSAEVFNPEAWDLEDVPVPITILAADRFNNIVPDDTAIVFTTELGAVVAQCLTVDGRCTVSWRSQDPRTSLDNSPQDTGRSTILAHAVGEESFEDEDGDGVFSGTAVCADPPVDGADCYYDLPEAWLDQNENGVRNGPTEDYVDFNSNGSHDGANGKWDGIVCPEEEESCVANLVTISDSLVIVMARSYADIMIFDLNGDLTNGPINAGDPVTVCVAGTGTVVPPLSTITSIADITQVQTMPVGTTIELSASVGELGGKTSFTVPNTTSETPYCISASITGSASGESGVFEVTVTAPSGADSYKTISLNDT